MIIYQHIKNLIQYGFEEQLLEKGDEFYARNRILATLGIDEWQEPQVKYRLAKEDRRQVQADVSGENLISDQVDSLGENQLPDLADILNGILDWAYQNGRLSSNTITERDLFDTEIMNCLMPRPSEVIREFQGNYEKTPTTATDRFYQLSMASNYIRTDRIAKNKVWKAATPYGEIDITVNLSKPELDPKEIARLRELPVSSYPTCLLCPENEGYKGTLGHPARATHRVIPVTLNQEDWCLQYSPYVYYNEHSIVFRKQHVPMKISRATFDRLLDFTETFPHYFIGSNADLPIVGGSILSHDHFQGGRYTFAIERADLLESMKIADFPDVTIGMVNWPMSVVRVSGSKEGVAGVTEYIWRKWQMYSDPNAEVFAFSGEIPHNTVTPIARRRGELYEMDIVLRNNRTSEFHPDGIFHPHQELHHIKKENIGLIEVMGLAVLPGRLATELAQLAEYLVNSVDRAKWEESLFKHWDWYVELKQKYPDIALENVNEMIEREVGLKFQQVLEHAGVFKQTPAGKTAFSTFLQSL